MSRGLAAADEIRTHDAPFREDDLVDAVGPSVRGYQPEDELGWVRCRTLAFLGTSYFDDVAPRKPVYETRSIELVATTPSGVIGLLDVAIDGELATLETIAIHPDEERRGIGTALLDAAVGLLPPDVTTVDAWTRDDVAANAWYLRSGFAETYRYLHVFASGETELQAAIRESGPGLTPAAGFFHAGIEAETSMKQQFRRVYICRRYEKSVRRKVAPKTAPR